MLLGKEHISEEMVEYCKGPFMDNGLHNKVILRPENIALPVLENSKNGSYFEEVKRMVRRPKKTKNPGVVD